MPLFEIVKTDATSQQCIVDTLGLSKQIKKTPVVVGNCTGFAVNRVFFPYTMSAFLIVDAGLDLYRVDAVIKDQFGMPMGPFRLSDLVGGDVGMHVGANFVESFPERVYPSNLLPNMCAAKRMGEKTGAGFYKFDAKRKASPDPEGVAPFLKISRDAAAGRVRVPPSSLRSSQLSPPSQPLSPTDSNSTLPAHTPPNPAQLPSSAGFSDDDIVEAVFFPVVNEGCRVLAEGIVSKAGDLDVAAIMGMGFPPFRGGLMHWADTVGAKRICDRLAELSKMYGGLYTPCDYLKQCAAKGVPLSVGPNGPASKM